VTISLPIRVAVGTVSMVVFPAMLGVALIKGLVAALNDALREQGL
jgi:hypothetical protein